MKSLTIQPFTALNRSEIAAIFSNLSRATVAVLGDFCLDVYWAVDRSASEVSLETGLGTEPVRRQRYSPGGAGNVVMNLLSLGVQQIYPVGVVGDDPFGRELSRLLENPHIDKRGLLVQAEGWATHAYVKPYVDGAELNRLDLGNFNKLAGTTESEFFARLEEIVSDVSVVLINHQVVGSIHDSGSLRSRLADVVRRHPEVCFITDSRKYHEAYANTVHKLNEREVLRSCGVSYEEDDLISLEDLCKHVEVLSKRWKAPLIVTRGARGCLVYADEIPRRIFGVQLPGRVDPVGAGDTFVATLAAITSTGTNLTAAAFVSNLAAAVTAQKLFQTGTATPEEIIEMEAGADYVYHPELAGSPHRARYHGNSEVEIVVGMLPAQNIKHIIFDHDGTISTLREGWEQIMEPMMLKAVLGGHFETADEPLFHRVTQRVKEFIERTTGIQTITQMAGLVELVTEFGLVPEKEIRTAAEYKAIYNRDLIALVEKRLEKLDRNELEISDFTLKGSVPFLHALREAGVNLYLASGTDEEDVKKEADRLGYGSLFNGGIYGSVGHIAKDAKKIVIERILHEIDGDFSQLVAIGDGPVEMRECIRRGGGAVGVASDEMRRFGPNPGKRSRLIQAGAQIIVPDFSQWRVLWGLLRLPGEVA